MAELVISMEALGSCRTVCKSETWLGGCQQDKKVREDRSDEEDDTQLSGTHFKVDIGGLANLAMYTGCDAGAFIIR